MARTSIGSTTNDWSVISGEDSNGLDDVDLNEEFGFFLVTIFSKLNLNFLFQHISQGCQLDSGVIFIIEKY